MVQTRSAAKKQQAEETQRLAIVPKHLVRENTVVEITPSATGLGTHIRWMRPPQRPNEMPEILSSDLTLDPRFVTPAPEIPTLSRTPPKLSRQHRTGNPGIFNIGTTVRFNLFRHEVEHIVESARIHGRDLLTEFQLYSLEEETSSDPRDDPPPTATFENVLQNHTLALRSPFPGTHVETSTPLSLGPQRMHPDIFLNDFGQGNDTGYPTRRLGPQGTHLIILPDDSAPTYNQTPGLTQGALFTGGIRGLGPSGTVLIGTDGRAIVPGIRPGYWFILFKTHQHFFLSAPVHSIHTFLYCHCLVIDIYTHGCEWNQSWSRSRRWDRR